MARSEALLHDLAGRHRDFLRFLERRVGNREDAEDLLQSAFVRAIDRGDQIRDDESAVAWFYRLLRNGLIDHYRTQDARGRAVERAASLEETRMEPDELARDIACQCVLAVLPHLKSQYGQLLREIDVEGRDLGDVAQQLGIARGNARVRLHRAREALRKAVFEACRTCAEHACVDCTCRRSGLV